MNYLTILLIAFGLSVDAFAVSVSNGICIRDLKVRLAFRIALFFGLFQALMPVLGWFAGNQLIAFIGIYSRLLSFLILSALGLKMIADAKRKEDKSCFNCKKLSVLFLFAIATSIDAFAVGFSFSLLSISILRPVIIIGLTTFIISLAGLWIGRKIGHFFENSIELIGGIVLILIGIKILTGF